MAEVLKVSENMVSLKGDLVFPVIMKARQQVELLLSKSDGLIEIDFTHVATVDSSALSFWFCCLRYAKKVGVEVRAINLPAEMIEIADLVGLDKQFS